MFSLITAPGTGHAVAAAAPVGCSPFPRGGREGPLESPELQEEGEALMLWRQDGDAVRQHCFCMCASGDPARCRKPDSPKRRTSPRPLALNLDFFPPIKHTGLTDQILFLLGKWAASTEDCNCLVQIILATLLIVLGSSPNSP